MQGVFDYPADALPRALRRSLGLHLRWLAGAVHPDAGVARPANRALKLAAALPPYAALQIGHAAGFAADSLFFRAERRQAIPSPLFVLGIPRSGTTFVHRLLAEDSARFSSMRAWEAVLAPSVSERRLWQSLGAADAVLGGAGRRLRDALLRRAAGDFDAVHPISADDAEEDYLALLPLAGCFLAVLAAPERPELWRLAALDRAPEDERALLLGAYRRILQKHCFAAGWGRQLLSKNAAFASWAGALAAAFPDARFILCIREPEAALASQLSAIAGASHALGNDLTLQARRFAQLFAGGYRHLADSHARHRERMAVVAIDDLRARPGATLEAALTHLDIARTPALRTALARAEATAGQAPQPRPAPTDLPAPPATLLAAMKRDYARLHAARWQPDSFREPQEHSA
jgi:hypothetical protein